MASPDFQASEFDLGVTSIRLIRVGNVVQIFFSKKPAAAYYYAEASARFKKGGGRIQTLTEMGLTPREKREIRALADASYEALVEVTKASKARHGKRLEAKANPSRPD